MDQMASKLICENEVISVFPSRTRRKLHLRLAGLLLSQNNHYRGCYCNRPAPAVFCGNKQVCAADLFRFLELFVDVERVGLKVHTVPGQ